MISNIQPIQSPAKDGFLLSSNLYLAELEKGKVVIINSATGVSKTLYHHYALFLQQQGYSVITYDYRGIAASRPEKLRGFKASFNDWGQLDFHGVVDYVTETFPHHKIIVLGHSIGGTLVGISENIQRLSGVLTIGAQPAFYKDWKPFTQQIKLYFLWHLLFPFLNEVVGYMPGKSLKLIEDIPYQAMKDWNQRRKSPNISQQFKAAGCDLFFDSYKEKLLTIGIADDPIGTTDGIRRIHDLFQSAEKEWLILNDEREIGHFGFFSRKFEKTLWIKTLEWVETI